MAKKYIAPRIQARLVKIEMIATSPQKTSIKLGKYSDTTIDNPDDILTKERSFFDEGEPFGMGEW